MTKKTEFEQLPLFLPEMGTSIAAKDQIDLMVYPFFSLSKSKRTTPIEYDDGKVKVEVSGLPKYGIASVYDADVLIYAASKVIEAMDREQRVSRRIQMSRYDILEFLGKGTGGDRYKRLIESLERLQATTIRTTIDRSDEGNRFKKREGFSWLDSWRAIEKNGKPVAVEIILGNWFFEGVVQKKILTLPHKYFRIESGMERFLYRLCRKVIGKANGELKMKLETINERSGQTNKPSHFRKKIEEIVEKQSVPDYWLFLLERNSTGDFYLCGKDKKFYKNAEDAQKDITFIELDYRLIRKKSKLNGED